MFVSNTVSQPNHQTGMSIIPYIIGQKPLTGFTPINTILCVGMCWVLICHHFYHIPKKNSDDERRCSSLMFLATSPAISTRIFKFPCGALAVPGLSSAITWPWGVGPRPCADGRVVVDIVVSLY